MAAKTPERRRIAATIAAIERHQGPDDPRLPTLRRELEAAQANDQPRIVNDRASKYATELVATWPDLTAETRRVIADQLRPFTVDDAA